MRDSAEKIDASIKKYRESQKGKEAQERYLNSELGKKARANYLKSQKGQEALLRYRLSEKGQKSIQTYQDLRRFLSKAAKWVESHQGTTLEDYLATLSGESNPKKSKLTKKTSSIKLPVPKED